MLFTDKNLLLIFFTCFLKGHSGSWYWKNADADGYDVKVDTTSNSFKQVWGYRKQSNPWECFFWNPKAIYGIKSWYGTACSRKRGFICQYE